MLNVSIIGYGYWGSKLARNFQNSTYFNISSIVDKKEISLNIAKKNLKVVEQKLRSVFSLDSRMAVGDKIRFCTQSYVRNLS